MASQSYKILIKAKDQASGTFKKLGSVAKGTAGVVGGVAKAALGATVAVAAMGTAVAVLAKQSFDFADAIGKVATRTGMATDTIQAFQIAAIESGSTFEIANKSLEKFTRSVGDAQRGLKTQADIFKDLGVEIKDVNGNTKDMDTLLREVSDGMSKLESQSEKATAAANLFGRAGIQIVDVLDNGAAAFDAYIKKAQDYGLILDEKGIRKSEKFNDTLALINRQFKVIRAVIAIAFLPIVQTLATNISEVTKDFAKQEGSVEDLGVAIRDKLITGFIATINIVADVADSLQDFKEFLIGSQQEVSKFFLQARLLMLEIENEFASFGWITHIHNVEKAVEEGARSFEDLMDTVYFAGYAYDDFNSKQHDIIDNYIKTKVELMEITDALEKGDKSNKRWGDNLRARAVELEKILNNMVKEGGVLPEFLKNWKEIGEQGGAALTDLLSPLDKFRDSLEETQIALAKDNAIVKSFKDAEDALVDFVKTGELSFKKMIDSFITELIRLQIRMSIIKPFFEAFESAGGFGKGGVWAGFGALFGGGKADGGAVSRNTPYLVGEKGAELFIPNTSGQIITNQNTEAMMGKQQPLNVNFSIQATDASGFDQLLTARKNQIISMVSQAMNQKGKAGLI